MRDCALVKYKCYTFLKGDVSTLVWAWGSWSQSSMETEEWFCIIAHIVKGFLQNFKWWIISLPNLCSRWKYLLALPSIYAPCILNCTFFYNIYRFCEKQVLLNPGRRKTAVNVVECDFDLLGRIFILQNWLLKKTWFPSFIFALFTEICLWTFFFFF